MRTVELEDGRTMPTIGLGTYPMTDDEAATTIPLAVDLGYRLIDTATLYGNETGVGRGLAASSVPREDLFVTTKVWNDDHGRRRAVEACERSLDLLGLDYLDLYLIHWPVPQRELYVETWEALVEIRERGLARSIGVSNFAEEHLTRIIGHTGVTPAVNQIELHPYFQQAAMRAVDASHDIVTQSWSPLGRGTDALTDPTIADIAMQHGVTPAQVILRWHLHRGAAPIPKSTDPTRLAQNLDVFDFALDSSALEALDALDAGQRVGGDPHTNED